VRHTSGRVAGVRQVASNSCAGDLIESCSTEDVDQTLDVRPAATTDVTNLASCQVACWREAYAHLLSASLLGSFEADERRHEQWRRMIAADSGWEVLVAEADGQVVGYITTAPSRDQPPVRALELVSIYLRAAHHGSGLGQGLLDAAVGDRPCSLWVADDNPRARAFYTRNGFQPDGAHKTGDSLGEPGGGSTGAVNWRSRDVPPSMTADCGRRHSDGPPWRPGGVVPKPVPPQPAAQRAPVTNTGSGTAPPVSPVAVSQPMAVSGGRSLTRFFRQFGWVVRPRW